MKIALVGNQNSGKTTLFNTLTGSNQKVGNWPGVTIDRKEGIIKDTTHEIIDLPGIYSLSPYTTEEEISRKFIFEERPDIIINIIDTTSIERSLYLTTQLLELDSKVIIALNMTDLLDKKGITIDAQKLSRQLHTDVVQISALKNSGITELIGLIQNYSMTNLTIIKNKIYDSNIELGINDLINELSEKTKLVHKRFVAVKILEKDPAFEKYVDESINKIRSNISSKYKVDMEQTIADQRYNFIVGVKKDSTKESHYKESVTDKLDKIFLNKWAAIPIFACVMFLIYFLAVGVVGSLTVDLVDSGVGALSDAMNELLTNWGASPWAVSLVCDGIITGVGAVLNFVPQLIILFTCICLLETSGYMSRIAFFLDKLFVKLGLSGKSLIPFIIGSGCSVPAIMSTRTIEDPSEKEATIMLTPFVPCSAKLPIIALFAGAFFDNYSGLVSVSLYFMAIVVIVISALLMKKFIYKKKSSTFISELPEYKVPSAKYVFRDVLEKTVEFLKRAGTIILLCSVVVWFAASFSWKFDYDVEIDDSILASIGNCFAWLFYPMLGTWSWEATVSAIQGLVAKEQVVSSMNILAGLADDSTDTIALFQSSSFAFFSGVSAYAFCVFNLFSAPCFGAIGAMKKELGSTKKMWKAILFQTGTAWVLAVIVFAIGTLIVSI